MFEPLEDSRRELACRARRGFVTWFGRRIAQATCTEFIRELGDLAGIEQANVIGSISTPSCSSSAIASVREIIDLP